MCEHEAREFGETLDQAAFADRTGFDCWWAVEHHGALELSWSSAPEMLLAWIATRTSRIHLGHAGVLAPFKIDHPIRIPLRSALWRSATRSKRRSPSHRIIRSCSSMEVYRDIGATRLLCMFQYVDLAHESVLASMGTVAKHLIPACAF